MSKIQVLDQITIDKIAAGEVIERPSSVAKELVENAIDAGATSVTVEIRDGGITFMRIADNGCGIPKEDVPNAFLRHSTSKIRTVEDLSHIGSLGFRGEALSSIAAVSQVEILTKTRADSFGTRYRIAGGKEEGVEEDSAPDGTTFFVRQLFYNVPARRKFLKTAMTEASHVGDLLTRLSMSHPEISFHFINNGQSKLHTSGNGNLRDVIYHIYGREIAANLLAVDYEKDGVKISGYLGAPLISRGNRNFENFYINHRYIRSNMVFKGIEDAYRDFSMQHKFPFVVLHMEMSGEEVDVNVHPTKMDIRFHNQQQIYNVIYEAVYTGLHERELIPQVTIDAPKAQKTYVADTVNAANVIWDARPKYEAEKEDLPKKQEPKEQGLDYFMEEMRRRVQAYHAKESEVPQKQQVIEKVSESRHLVQSEVPQKQQNTEKLPEFKRSSPPGIPQKDKESQKQETLQKPEILQKQEAMQKPKQLDLFEENLLKREIRAEYKLIGQVFDTYWLVEFQNQLYIIDQHAAHERVLYEKTLREMKTREFTSQMISPPIILNLTMQEQELLQTYMDRFTGIGFEIEEFGQESFAVRAVPANLFSVAKKDLLMEMIDSLSDEISRNLSPDIIDEKVASMSCKAAVKGNMKLSVSEVDALIGELLTLENPYHCPHGRPTIIAMSKRELEKKFKRIV